MNWERDGLKPWIEAAARRLHQLPKVIEGVKFTDGIEANRNRAAV